MHVSLATSCQQFERAALSCHLPPLQALADKLAAVDTTGWQLVVTGHSLGAGAAALVALYAHNYFPRCGAVHAIP